MNGQLETKASGSGLSFSDRDIQMSQAISLKRIADALQTIASPDYRDGLHNAVYNAIATSLMEDRQRR